MKERKLIICRGIQGSGKSTWSKQWCHEDPEHRVRFNNDDIRSMLGDYWVPSREKLVTEAKANMITFALINGYDVVVDNMNLNPKEDTLTNSMAMFIVINTASLQLIPTNVIAIRSSLGSSSPSGIIIQVWFATIIAGIVGITSAKFLMKKF